MHAGEYSEALPVLDAAVRRAEEVGDLPTLCTALDFVSVIHHSLRRPELALEFRRRALDVAERLDDPREISYRAVEAAYVTFLLGDWEQSRMYAEHALQAALSLDSLNMYFQPLVVLGELGLYAGKWEQSAEYLSEADTIAEHLGLADMRREVQGLLAELDIIQGNAHAALARLRPLLTSPGWEEHLNFLLALAWTYLETGDLGGAEDTAERALEEATRQRVPVGQVEALRMQGIIASRGERWNVAAASFERALERAREIAYPWGEARALYGLGMTHAGRQERKPAEEQLRRAHAIFGRLGAHAYSVDVERVLQSF